MRRTLLTVSTLAILAALLAGPAIADDEKGDGTAPASTGVEVKVVEEYVEMEAFLRTVAKATGMPLVWNPADKNIRGKRIVGNVDMTMPRDQLFRHARALLTFYELVIIPVGPKGHEVHLVMDARQTSSILKLKPEHVTFTDENLDSFAQDDGRFVTTTIHVEHMDDLRNARNALTRIVTGQNIGNVTEVPTARAFIVTDFAPNAVACYRLIREMDVPQVKPTTTAGRTVAISLEHANASELADVLVRHYAAAPQSPRAPQMPGAAPASAPRITADERTNRILVTGDDPEIKAVQAAVALLDVRVPKPPVPPVPPVSVALIPIKHINVPMASETLRRLIQGAPAMWSGGDARPQVVPHENAALLVTASEADMAKIRALLAEMDKE